jgi:acyl transferase domain-containing protein/3-hydroxymyristoyl/3-hydroxydecanoyl-(acyl carrier protein) dehydratase/1-acyl-sn-glycerol-3-phosphate acyltransferase
MRAMAFEPIAIVGRSCILPGVTNPESFWQAVVSGQNLTGHAPSDYWQLSKESVLTDPANPRQDHAWSDRGGFVSGFEEVFDPAGFNGLSVSEVKGLDPLFQWVLHGCREALRSADLGAPLESDQHSTGLILGNLSYPSSGLTKYAEIAWYEQNQYPVQFDDDVSAANRFCSGYPAHLAASALGLTGTAYSLDAACASSLYAIKLACDQLHDGRAKTMIAGAVNRADDLFIKVGFCALSAMSRKGISRPFDKNADGLLPAEGAAFIVLKRLSDALDDGHDILGVIRGVGLSNDGRSGGFLAPSKDGQIRAMKAAYEVSGISPDSISLLECHATGTPVGDRVELESSAEIFKGQKELPIGSLKSNMGHLITVAGLAGILKVIASFEHKQRPPTIHVDEALDIFNETPFRLIKSAENWDCDEIRRGAVSAFGFGGNNAHVIVEEWTEISKAALETVSGAPKLDPELEIAIVAIETQLPGKKPTGMNWDQFEDSLLGESPAGRELTDIELQFRGLRFPPKDLDHCLPQQLLMLELARRVAAKVPGLDDLRDSTAILIGMGVDPEIARYAARWRLPDRLRNSGQSLTSAFQKDAQNAFIHGLEAAGVIGTMPNIPANRINSQLNVQGPSFTVSSEELSGLRALDIAERALRNGEANAAIVGAVDFSAEPVHKKALKALAGNSEDCADGGVVMVLMRLEDAIKAGHSVMATVSRRSKSDVEWTVQPELAPRIGRSHASYGLLQLAGAVVACQRQIQFQDDSSQPVKPVLSNGPRQIKVEAAGLGGQSSGEWYVSRHMPKTGPVILEGKARKIFVYSGSGKSAVLAALESGQESNAGPARLVLTGSNTKEWSARAALAKRALSEGIHIKGALIAPGVYYSAAPMEGELGYVYTGAAAAYAGMGQELFSAFPQLSNNLLGRFPSLVKAQPWLDSENTHLSSQPFEVLHGCSFLCQAHSELTRQLISRKPDAALGMSSGETNSMFAMGAWTDLEEMFKEIHESGMYQEQIAGDYQCARTSWAGQDFGEINWTSWRLLCPVNKVEEAVKGEDFVRLTMINTDSDCVIGGQADACQRVLGKLGRVPVYPLGHDIIAHAPEMKAWQEPWYKIHLRETQPVEDVRFYSNAFGTHYQADSNRIAQALTNQATDRVDFRKVIEAAWNDGVRIFVEHGPRSSCTTWIQQILGDRSHVAVALDKPGQALDTVIESLALLVAVGVPVNLDQLHSHFDQNSHSPTVRTYPAHFPTVRLPVVMNTKPSIQKMAPAPTLPSVFEDSQQLPQGAPIVTSAVAPAVRAPSAVAPSVAAQSYGSQPAVRQSSIQSEPAADIGLRLVQFHQSVASAHSQFLALQGQMTRQFLSLRAAQPGIGSAVSTLMTPIQVSQHLAPATAPELYRPSQQVVSPMPVQPGAPHAPAPVTVERVLAEKQAPARAPTPVELPGLKIDREGLKILASGKISQVLGPLFKQQDDFRRQVRMPEPPLLLADRVTGIDSAAGSMGKGRIWTETDVSPDAWYLHYGRMPTGIMIESGQADLLLISWLGADFENRGERVYRLLGCELTFHAGGLPAVGETLVFDINIDGYAQQGPIRLFFFHYDCLINDKARLSVRHGQAGFFTDEELADSAGILWSAEETTADPYAQVDAPTLLCESAFFSAEQVMAFSNGRLVECFGEAFEASRCHVRTPKISSGRMLLFDEVTHFEPTGGPWKRGYLRALDHLVDDEWFFAGHFKNDPCMPGTLMFEGCVQTMSFYLAAMGVTIERDGWLFEPVPDLAYQLRCRGQVTPGARTLEYEVFVEEFIAGPIPMLKADLLCTVDGLKAFHCKGMKLRLAPSWPLQSRAMLTDGIELKTQQHIARGADIEFDFYSLAACAWGQPSHGFGKMYSVYDSERRCPRLPGPPYHFISRVTKLEAKTPNKKPGGYVEVEYDVPPDAWYFAENGRRVMPYCVLLEAALQPCGWLASYIGCALGTDEDVYFRNLDGTSTLHEEITPRSGTLKTTVKSTTVSQAGPMIIVGFEVKCYLADRCVYEMKTVFGFFPKESLAQQVGLPATQQERDRVSQEAERHQWLRARPEVLFQKELRLAGPMLMLLDSINAWDAQGGEAGLGRACGEIRVDAGQWFFKSHFFGDPVQPGSLGIEAMLQLFQWVMLEKGLAETIENPRFESIQLGAPMSWKYRGQVMPHNKRVTLEINISEQSVSEDQVTVTGTASYWCDGIRIYQATNIGMRIVSDLGSGVAEAGEILDPTIDLWLGDHCPTWTAPALAMMSMVDRLAAGALTRAPGRPIRSLRNVQVSRWLSFYQGARSLKVFGVPKFQNEVHSELLVWNKESEVYESVARGEVIVAEENHLPPVPWTRPEDAVLQENPYESGVLFHGPRYQALKEFYLGGSGSSTLLDANCAGQVPLGALNQRLLDAATHGIPHDRLSHWSSEIGDDVVAYPVSIPSANFYGAVPQSGMIRCEARFRGFKGGPRFPWISLQLIVEDEDRVWAEIELVEALFPKGPIGEATPLNRRAFLGEAQFVPGLTLSTIQGAEGSLESETVKSSNWLEGSVADAYQCKVRSGSGFEQELLVKDLLAQQCRVHQSYIDVTLNGERATVHGQALPVNKIELELSESGEGHKAQVLSESLDLEPLKIAWRRFWGHSDQWLGEDLFFSVVRQFVGLVTFSNPEEMAALSGRGVLFLANHQVGVESPLFALVASALQGLPTAVIAKKEHKDSWIGRLFEVCFDREELQSPELLALVDRDNQMDVIQTIAKRFAALAKDQECLLIHVEGTRSQQGGRAVELVSSAVIDQAVATGIPIVPVRFSGALPVDHELEERTEFPAGYGRQDILFGRPLFAEELKSLTTLERRNKVLEALNTICGGPEFEALTAPNPEFQKKVEDWKSRHQVSEVEAVLFQALAHCEKPCEESQAILDAAHGKALKSVDTVSGAWLERCLRDVFGLKI